MASLAIETHGLTKTYGRTTALNDLDLRVPAGSIVGFLGPNGSGKSTTIKLLLGLARPTAGGGTVLGHDITREGPAVRSLVGYLAQKPAFDPTMTAREVVRFSASFDRTLSGTALEDRVQESLAAVGLAGKEDQRARTMSGGELQRVGIAQASVTRPPLLILDEPASALDPVGRAEVLETIRALRGTSTVFFSTHILDDVQNTSDHVIILKRGQLAAEGPIQQLLSGGGGGPRFEATLLGGSDELRDSLGREPWVRSVTASTRDGLTRWTVEVSDAEVAAERLVRFLVADPAVRLIEYGPERRELEDVFLDLVRKETPTA